jgi:hypothetical protein
MPIETREVRTRSGYRVLSADFQPEVTVEEARRYHEQLVPGGRYDGCGHLIVGTITGVSAEVKKVLASREADPKRPPPVAIVLTSALARMAAGLAMRMTNNPNTEYFKSEAEALEWLDERMRAFTGG